MLRVVGVKARFGMLQAVADISLELAGGEIVALLGPNGAGKSTLLGAISGFDAHPTSSPTVSGQIYLDGERIDGLPAHRRALRGIGHCAEGRESTFPGLTVSENLELGGHALNRRIARGRIDEMLGLFPQLAERRRQLAGSLSGGERQMLAIARTLMMRPRVLLLDEPAVGLAPPVAELVYRKVRGLVVADTMTVLLVDPSPRRAFSIASRGYLVQAGTITRQGPRDELCQAPEIADAYLHG